MAGISRFPQPEKHTPDAAAPGLTGEQASEMIRMLFGALTVTEQERVFREMEKSVRPIPAPRAGQVLGAIVRLLPRQKSKAWTTDEVKDWVAGEGIGASNKEIYNALGYLARKGHIKRVGYGRYIIDGAGMVTSDDFGEQPLPNEDD